MNIIKDGEDALRAEARLRVVLDRGKWFLTTDIAQRAVIAEAQFELRVEWGKLLLTWWSEDLFDSCRVIGFDVLDGLVRLQARRGMTRATVTLTLWQAGRDAAVERLSYLNLTRNILLQYDRRLGVRSATTTVHRSGRFRSGYTRLVLERRGAAVLAMGVSAFEDQQIIDGVVEAGLVWVTRFNQTRKIADQARELWLLLPKGRARTVIERLTLISTHHLGTQICCLEIDEDAGTATAISIAAQMELLSTHPRRLTWPAATPSTAAVTSLRSRIVQLAPDLIEVRPAIGGRGEKFMIHGLEFARWSASGRPGVLFGVRDWKRLTSCTFRELKKLVDEMTHWRRADSPDRKQVLYRLRAEGWLESIIRQDIRGFDPTLDERFVYSQIPAWRGDERSVLDLLAVDHGGRLVVIEIKAAEDPMLPLQGLDYWLRVEEARRQHQFEQRGLFPGVKLADRTPLLYLVTPRLRFHRTFAEVAACLSPEVEAYRIGINANWRAGLKVLSRERVNPGQ